MRFVFLALLARGPVHGYELKRIYDRLFASVWGPINVGQIYVTMGRLERDGFVAVAAPHPDDEQAGRKRYELTELGRKELDAWIGARSDAVVKSDAVLRLVAAGAHSPAALDEVIRDHRMHCLATLRDLDATAAAAPPGSFEELLVRHATFHLDGELRWLDLVDERRAQGGFRLDAPEATR